MRMRRRDALAGLAAAGGALSAPGALAAPTYRGPKVVVIRFGGGVRRRETIEAGTSYAPRLLTRLAPRGVLMPQMTIAQLDGVDTSHAEGTLNLLTGRYRAYRNVGARGPGRRLQPTEPTLFEILRRRFAVPAHEALMINGEDRPQEEYFSYGVHRAHGVAYKSEVLSLYRFKIWRWRRRVASGEGTPAELTTAQKALARLERLAPQGEARPQSAPVEAFWARWAAAFGEDGLKNPRGDRALTELALRALRDLRPRFMMINYQDPDYVHWGNASHYTRAIAVIDEGVDQIARAVEADPEYRGDTLFMIVPDCGRDANALMNVPFQHHFNSRSAHEIWALAFGPGIVRGAVLDKPVDQTSVAATLGAAMGLDVAAEGRALEEVFA